MLHFPSPDIGMFGRRQRHVRGHRIPVTITHAAKADPGSTVVVDTFGADDVTRLPGGCACCTVRAELQATLRRMLAEREKRPFSHILIESRREPGPILRTFATERALGADFYVESDPADAFGSENGVQKFVLTEAAPLSWDAFSRFITTLTALRSADLLQMKGLLNIAGCREAVAVHAMGHLAQRPIELQAWPTEDRATRLEFVTRGIEERAVRDLFNSVRSLT
jgi:G3E family GTPase